MGEFSNSSESAPNAGRKGNRSIERTLDIGWKVLKEIPQEDLLRVKREYIEKYMNSTN